MPGSTHLSLKACASLAHELSPGSAMPREPCTSVQCMLASRKLFSPYPCDFDTKGVDREMSVHYEYTYIQPLNGSYVLPKSVSGDISR